MGLEGKEVVRSFLDEAVSELWKGNIKVTYSPEWEDPSEPAFYAFFHKGLYVEVVENRRTGWWAQLEYENLEDLGPFPGMEERLYEAVSAPERNAEDGEWTEEELQAIRTSWEGHHKRGRKGAVGLIRKALRPVMGSGAHRTRRSTRTSKLR